MLTQKELYIELEHWLMVMRVMCQYCGKDGENAKRWRHPWAYLAAGPVESSLWPRQRCLSVGLLDHPTLWRRLYNSHKRSSQTPQNHIHRCYLIREEIGGKKTSIIKNRSCYLFMSPTRNISIITTLLPVHVGVSTHPPGTLSGRPLLTQLAP